MQAVRLDQLISSTSWPYRLLHIPSMTSYIRQGERTYNGIDSPDYNIISYTWGYYMDSTRNEPQLDARGIDWPISLITASHFTAENFRSALQRVAQGVKFRCDWVWVDVACIPQPHDDESEEAKRIRGEEIGRQVEIFHTAKETFVWLCSMTSKNLASSPRGPQTFDDFLMHLNKG
ncbi:hypothetical protein CC80DRAFT_560530, partial [Byssothecium circinans]